MNDAIFIHPLDLHDILNAEDGPTDVLIYQREGVEFFEIPDTKYKGVYKQTVDVPVTSEFGKKVLEEASRRSCGGEREFGSESVS